MARTDKLQQSQLMMSAADSGNAAAQRAHDSRQGRRQQDLNRAENARQFDAGVDQRNQDRWNQQWQAQRKAKDERAQKLSTDQANKQRGTNFGTEGRMEGDPRVTGNDQFDAQVEERRREFDQNAQLQRERAAQDQSQFDSNEQLKREQMGQQQQQFDTQTQMQAADKGLVDPRMAQMQAEMNRGKEQMGQPIESDQNGGFVKSQQRQDQEKMQGETAQANAETARVNAVLRRRELERSYQQEDVKFNAAKTASERKEAEAKRDAVDKQLIQPLESNNATMNRLRKGDQANDLWQSLAADAKGVPDEQAIQQDIKNRTFGAALARFMNAKQSSLAIKYTAGTGNMPPGKTVDYSSAGMQLLVKNTTYARQKLLTGVNAQLFRAMTQEDFISTVNKTAAEQTVLGRDMASIVAQSGVNGQDIRNQAQGGDNTQQSHRMVTDPRTGKQIKTINPGYADERDKTADFSNKPYPGKAPPQQGQRGPYVDLPGPFPLAGVQ